MARNKKGAFGKKAARLRAATAGAAAAVAAPTNTSNRAGSGKWQPRNREAVTDFESPALLGTTMQEVARNTTNKASHWDQDTRLRDRPVNFVSGGFVEPLTELELSEVATPVRITTDIVPSDGFKKHEASSKRPLESAPPKLAPPTEEPAKDIPSMLQRTTDVDSDSSDEVILFKGRDGSRSTQPTLADIAMPITAAQPPTSTSPTGPPEPTELARFELLVVATDEEGGSDAAIDDYIANMDSDDMQDMMKQLSANRRDLGGNHNDIVIDAASTDDDGDNEDGAVYRRVSVFDGADGHSEAEGEVDSEDDIGDESDDLDETGQLVTDVDDEQLARLLAKQEELGLGADELILLDGDSTRAATATKARRPGGQPRRSKGSAFGKQRIPPGYDFTKGLRASDGTYPSAEAVADAFEQLEVTAWTSGRDRFHLELSDSELEATLEASWQKDRMRKKEKKRAREEMRAQGLLGKKANPDDPRIKYPSGMNLDDMKAEFQTFLLGAENSFTLPPMDAHARKIVHEIAYRFNITSKSTGSGDQRRPTLVRTKSTVRFSEDQFHSIFAKYQRRFFARLDGYKNGAVGSKRAGGGSGHRGDPGAAIVRNGEIVGGSAPEIGQANKGRTMLEKMGWSIGMALGATDNKGMTQPIEHIVKRSKAGLG